MKLNFRDIANLILAVGKSDSVMVQGEMGIGKSTILHEIARRTDYKKLYFDCATITMADLGLPFKTENNEIEFIPLKHFGMSSQEPVVICLDELTKAAPEVLNALLPMLLERRLFDHMLPEDSIVFCTGNLIEENLGDVLPAHVQDRMTLVEMRKPTAEEWVRWASDNEIHPALLGWVSQTPECLAEMDSDRQNPYIKKTDSSNPCVTPRSLAAASRLMDAKSNFSNTVLQASLEGRVGRAAAQGILKYLVIDKDLPDLESFCENGVGRLSTIQEVILSFRIVEWLRQNPTKLDAILNSCTGLKAEARTMVLRAIKMNGKITSEVRTHPFILKQATALQDYI